MDPSPIDIIKQKHKIEKRDLQSRITQKKKNATKKTRKGVNDECLALEVKLQESQAAELKLLEGEVHDDVEKGDEVGLSNLTIEDSEDVVHEGVNHHSDPNFNIQENSTPTSSDTKPKKVNRQKARLARRAADQALATAQAEDEATNIPDRRAEEMAAMTQEFEKRGLQEHEIRSDGHCLYAAVADQLQSRGIPPATHHKVDYKTIRQDTAKYVEEHPEDFVGFLEESLESYVNKIRDTGEWGGHLEMSALSKLYSITINVLQSDGRLEEIRSNNIEGSPIIWLAYYRYSFGLGEHYNSLRART